MQNNQNDRFKAYYTPREVSEAIGVSEASVKRWCDKGYIRFSKTPGGHRKLAREHIIQFLRGLRKPIAKPHLIGLPAAGIRNGLNESQLLERITDALLQGKVSEFRALVVNQYLSGQTTADIGDQLLAPAFERIGSAWKQNQIEIFQERRAVNLALSVLREMESWLELDLPERPLAFCASFSGDRYEVPLAMVTLAVKEQKLRVEKLGTDLPCETLVSAVDRLRPDLFCLSVSTFSEIHHLETATKALHEACKKVNSFLVLGGRALSDHVRKQISYDLFCENLSQVASLSGKFTQKLQPNPQNESQNV